MMARQFTIRDLARELGFSASTVSRALNRPEMLPAVTVEKVVLAAERMNYRPDRVARALSSGRTGNVAVIVPDIANPFFPPLLRAAQAVADGRDSYCFLGDSDENPVREEQLVRRLSQQVDGILLVSSRLQDDVLRDLASEVNLVAINRDVEGVRRVLIDTASAVIEAMTTLTELGHRRFAYVAGPASSWSNQEREKAAVGYARSVGASLRLFRAEPATYVGATAVVKDVIAADATAVVAFDDLIAGALVNGLVEEGRRVPEDVSVVGCDDVQAVSTRPPVTTIESRSTEAGERGMALLLDGNAGAPEVREVLASRIIVRESIGPARA